jgi:hypothetical protein
VVGRPHQDGPRPIGPARHCPTPRARQCADIESQGTSPSQRPSTLTLPAPEKSI